jgi:carbohydrate-selective porin OprB
VNAHLENSPDQRMHDISAPVQRIEHNDHGSKSVALVATILASVALGAILIAAPLVLIVIDAKVTAAAAEAAVNAREARTNSRVALDKVEDFRAKLAAKGVDVGPLDGH